MEFCLNENDDTFLNKCHKETPAGFFTMFANYLLQFINPRSMALTVIIIIMALPMLQLSGVRSTNVTFFLRKFIASKLGLLNFLHRICYTLILDVALYPVFRQYRPCRCTSDGGATFAHVGSLYGLPSGDAMSGAIFASYLFDEAPFQGVASRIIALIIIPLISFERVILGYHTVTQVTVGSMMGVLLHIYSTRVPQFFIFFDALFSIVLGLITLSIDSALVYHTNDLNNLMAWFFWGISFQVFVCLLLGRYYFTKSHFAKLKHSIRYLLNQSNTHAIGKSHSSVEVTNEILLLGDLEGQKADKPVSLGADMRKLSDSTFTIIAFAIFLMINFFSYCITQYGWLTRIK